MPKSPHYVALTCALMLLAASAVNAADSARSSTGAHSSLGLFVQAVFARSPQLAVGESSLAAADQNAKAAAQPLYNPSLELDAEDAEQNTYYAGLSQTVDLYGKRHASGAVGQARLVAAQAQQAGLRQRLAADALQALADYDGARREVELAAASEAVLQRFFKISQGLRNVGEIGDPDLSLARLALANAVRDRAKADRDLATARAALALASRVPERQWPQLPAAAPPEFKAPAGEAALNRLVLELPEVRRAQAQAKAAVQQAELARRQRHADPTVSVRGGREGDFGLVGLNLSVPLNIRNSHKAEAKAAAYQASAEKFTATDTRDTARLRLLAARELYAEARAASLRWQDLAGGRVDDGIDTLERLYRSGDLQATDYLTQLREHLNARAAGVELHTAAWRAWFEWLDASGRWRQWLTGGTASTKALQ